MTTALIVLAVLASVVVAMRAAPAPDKPVTGIASYYGEAYRGKRMANGQRFNPDELTCAVWDWPLGSMLEVRHEGRKVCVVVTDRGPAIRLGRLIDLSQAAFQILAPAHRGLITVTVECISRGDG